MSHEAHVIEQYDDIPVPDLVPEGIDAHRDRAPFYGGFTARAR